MESSHSRPFEGNDNRMMDLFVELKLSCMMSLFLVDKKIKKTPADRGLKTKILPDDTGQGFRYAGDDEPFGAK